MRPKSSPIRFLFVTIAWMGFILYLSSQPSSFYDDHLISWLRRFRDPGEYLVHFFLYFLLFQFLRGLLFSLSTHSKTSQESSTDRKVRGERGVSGWGIRGPQGERKALLAAVLLTSCFGILDELYQSTVPTRVCDPKDFLVDSLAALIGALLLKLFSRRFATSSSVPPYQEVSSQIKPVASPQAASDLGHTPAKVPRGRKFP